MTKHLLTWDNVETQCRDIVARCEKYEYDAIVPIARGGVIPGRIVHESLGGDFITIGCRSYDDDTHSQGELEWYQFPEETFRSKKYKRILLVDDICDTGATLEAAFEKIKACSPDSQILAAVIVAKSVRLPAFGEIIFGSTIEPEKWVVFPWEPKPEVRVSPWFLPSSWIGARFTN